MTGAGTVRSTGIGSWPGADIRDATAIAFAECPALPYVPELPARGPGAQLIGRTTALLAGLAVDLQPAGWRLSDASGRDHRRAAAALRADLDALEEIAQGYSGPVKFSAAGPWTLAACIERPRGDRVLGDPGARRDLTQSLAQGLADRLDELRRRLPDIDWVVQLDEPMLPAVLGGSVATASGLSRHRVVDGPDASAGLGYVVHQLRSAAVTQVVAHCCAARPPVQVFRRAGLDGVLLDVDQLGGADWDETAAALESGFLVGMGALPTSSGLNADDVARRILTPLRRLGLDPAIAPQLLVTPACGLAAAGPAAAVRALRTVRRAAEIVAEQFAY